jgi:hypothetical protein
MRLSSRNKGGDIAKSVSNDSRLSTTIVHDYKKISAFRSFATAAVAAPSGWTTGTGGMSLAVARVLTFSANR